MGFRKTKYFLFPEQGSYIIRSIIGYFSFINDRTYNLIISFFPITRQSISVEKDFYPFLPFIVICWSTIIFEIMFNLIFVWI